MAESYDSTDRRIVDLLDVKHSSIPTLAGHDQQTRSSADRSPIISIDHTVLAETSRSPSQTSNEGSSVTVSSRLALPTSPSPRLNTSVAVQQDNESGCVSSSLHTSEGGRRQLHREISFERGGCGTPASSLLEHPALGFESSNAVAPGAKTEERTAESPNVDTLIDDDILINAIPVVRDALHGAAKILDECLPRDNAMNSTSQLDARGSTFNDVGRDHYHINHINVNICPHGSLNTAHHRVETPNDPGPEPDQPSPLLERGIKHARTFIVTSIAAFFAQFES